MCNKIPQKALHSWQIPTTNICNLNCPTCIYNTVHDNHARFVLGQERFEKIIKKLPYNSYVDLTSTVGEIAYDSAALDKFDFLEAAPNISGFTFVTNGSILASEDYRFVLEAYSKIDNMTISVYGNTPEVFAKNTGIHPGPVCEAYFENMQIAINSLLVSKMSGVNRNCTVTFYIRYAGYTEDDFPQFKLVKHLDDVIIDTTCAGKNFDWSNRMVVPNLHPIIDEADRTEICLHAVNQNCIYPNGDVELCGLSCNFKGMMPLGNIFVNTIDEIYKKRDEVYPGKLCKKCREYEPYSIGTLK